MPTNHSNDFGTESENDRGFKFCIQYYAIIVFLINTSCTLLQVKYQTLDVTPFDTHYGIMLAFFLIMYAHAVILVVEIKLQTHNSSYHQMIMLGKISLFTGALASILPLLILVPAVGWFNLVLWAVCFVKVAHQYFCRLIYHAAIHIFHLLNKLLMNRRLVDRLPI
ncbi:hypothetical protein OWV82_000324 [Melia azedarach]|uniref:Uncharacterized protein n=1 Tax=Melia azedarach TaxID=155640 RepID=A0ACC1YVI4_MELAZ|nr:hypothetical protein OWV82_000324 [Melia azedarach]